VTAFAGNFNFVTARILTPVAAVLFAMRHIALARLVGALTLFVFHVLLLGAKKGAGIYVLSIGRNVPQP